jgi:hypothetical protein
MDISICKWYNNAASPVLFLIDDLANVWVDTNGNGKIDLEEDWGYGKDGENSSFKFLNKVILKDFPMVKTTFFVPVGVRVGMIENPQIKSVSKMINCDEETKKFFKSINDNPRYEIAYHGTTHGAVGKTRNDFKQEWQLFKNLGEAIGTINKGKEVYKEVFGYYPKGGKYCGYETNGFSDESIDKTGFIWWCRFYNKGLTDDKNCDIGGSDFNPLTNLDVKTFGNSGIVDIPSTLNGGLLTGVFSPNKKTLKGITKVVLKNYLIKKKLSKVDFLLENKLVISIQEHISPARDDGRRQTPNIFDDRESLKYIFNYLKDKNVWHCTGTELAEYYLTRNKINIKQINENEFEIINAKELEGKMISIKFDEKYSKFKIPNGKIIYKENGCFTFSIAEGRFKLQ